MLINMKNIDKYVGKFLKNSLVKSIGDNVPLKEIYNEYKLFMLMHQVEPKLYKNFRLEAPLLEVLDSSIEIQKMQDKYYVVNVKLIGKNIKEFCKELNVALESKSWSSCLFSSQFSIAPPYGGLFVFYV